MKFLVNTVKVLFQDHPIYPSVSIYFQGCDAYPKCVGCHNQNTWEFDESFSKSYNEILSLVEEKVQFLLVGYERVSVTFLGGEPLSARNRECVKLLSKHFKEKYGSKVVTTLYSWREPKDIIELFEYVESIDEFVLGRFEMSLKTGGFPSSSNQLYITKEELSELLEIERGKCCALEIF